MIRKILSFFLCAISYLNAASGSNPVSEDAEIFRLPGGTEISTSSVDTGDTGDTRIFMAVQLLEQFKLVLQDPNSIEGKSIIEQSVEQNLRQSVEQAIELKKTLFLDHEDRIRPNGATEIQFILYGSIS